MKEYEVKPRLSWTLIIGIAAVMLAVQLIALIFWLIFGNNDIILLDSWKIIPRAFGTTIVLVILFESFCDLRRNKPISNLERSGFLLLCGMSLMILNWAGILAVAALLIAQRLAEALGKKDNSPENDDEISDNNDSGNWL